jgi:shikimate kinase
LAEARHVILVGLPGAGKSAVGERLARRLGRPFLDFDSELERRTGTSVAQMFARAGEAAFRAAEAALAAELAVLPEPLVLAPGGGWVANPAAAATLRPRGRIIYLRVTPAAAVRRMGPAVYRRPLLATRDPVVALEELLARRASLYAEADITLDTESLTVDETVATLETLLREQLGG